MADILLPSVRSAVTEYGIACDVLPCDPDFADTAAFCEKYGFSPGQAANTILVASRKVEPAKYAVCVALATKACQLMGGGNRESKLVLDPEELLKLPNVEVIDGLAKPKE